MVSFALSAPEDDIPAFVSDEIALLPCTRIRVGGCREATVTAAPRLASSQLWPSLMRRACISGALLGRGGSDGIVLFSEISAVSAMVVRVL
jgi:hypothetical protein